MIDDKDGHIPSPLIMFTYTTLRHALLEWQKNKGVRPKASKSKLKADRSDHSNYYNCKNDGISKMYLSHWKPPGVSERMWSVNLDVSISGEYQTLGGHSCRPSE
jgi:hypothetical protein